MKKIPQVSLPSDLFLSTCVSDTLKLFSEHKSRNKRDGLYDCPSLVYSTSTTSAVWVLSSLVFIRTLIAVLDGKISMINRRLWYFLNRLFQLAQIRRDGSRDCDVVVQKLFPNQ